MISETQRKLDEFFGAFESAEGALLLSDYDGTLAPFRVDRFRARPWAGMRALLTEIQNQGETRVVIVTGRPAAEIAPLLALEPMPEVWGLHGAERLLADGKRQVSEAPRPARHKLDELGGRLKRDAFGGLFEEKSNAAVVHWRGASAKKARQIEKQTRALFEPLAEMYGLTLLEFEAGLELRAGPEKGDAVLSILATAPTNGQQPAAYLGDDISDESAFRAMKGRGLSVLVRREHRETEADIWLQPPHELREFLKRWARASRTLGADRLADVSLRR